jgi:hypothetical protein
VNRALVTFAVGPYEQLLEVSLPTMTAYAERHGYRLLAEPPALGTRPPSWMKLPLLRNALDEFDEVLWLDADVLIRDDSLDLADEVPADAWQALVRHHVVEGEVPNCGVWFLRAAMRPMLDQLWGMDEYLEHPWWEQGALVELLGYRGRPVQLQAPSELCRRTHWLGLEWNSHEERDRHPRPRFAHATYGPLEWRLAVMYKHVNERRSVAGEGA